MVKKYYKYIIVLLFGLYLFVPRETYALTVYAERFNDEKLSMATNDQTYWRVFTSNFNEKWVNLGSGYIRFNFSLQKYSGASTHQVLAPMTASVTNTLGNEFPCDIGTASVNNATHNEQIYSAICPVNFYNNSGLHSVVINFNTNTSTNDYAYYYIWLDGRFSFEVPQFIQDNSQAIINSQSQMIQQQQQTTKAIQGVDGTLKDDSIDEDFTESNVNGLINNDDVSKPGDVGIQDLITLPIKLFTGLLGSLSSTCNPISLELLNNTIEFPCINLRDYFGIVWDIFDLICSAILCFNFSKKLKEIFLDFTSLETNKGDLIE